MPQIVSLTEVLKDAAIRPDVINDAALLIDSEVASKRGISGTLLKSGYALVKRLNKGRFVHEVLEALLDDFVASIEPIHESFRAAPTERFAERLCAEEDRATQALLSVTDQRAQSSKHAMVRKTYLKLRPKAEDHVKQALPGLADLIDKYTRA